MLQKYLDLQGLEKPRWREYPFFTARAVIDPICSLNIARNALCDGKVVWIGMSCRFPLNFQTDTARYRFSLAQPTA